MRKWLRLGSVAGVCACATWAVDWTALRPQGYVNDYAGVVDSGTRSELEQYCAQIERTTGADIGLVTLGSLQGEPVADVAATIFRAWGPEGGRSHRIMVLLAIAESRDWIVMGPDLNPAVTHGLAADVRRETRPALRRKDYGEALRAAAETIGIAAEKARNLSARARLARRIRWTIIDSIPWAVLIGAVLIAVCLIFAGSPAGYGGFGSRGFLPGLLPRRRMLRSTWGSRGSGGFGGFDSGDSSGGFGAGACRDW